MESFSFDGAHLKTFVVGFFGRMMKARYLAKVYFKPNHIKWGDINRSDTSVEIKRWRKS